SSSRGPPTTGSRWRGRSTRRSPPTTTSGGSRRWSSTPATKRNPPCGCPRSTPPGSWPSPPPTCCPSSSRAAPSTGHRAPSPSTRGGRAGVLLADPIVPALGHLFVSHPWHGVPIGDQAPERVTVYVEMVPTDTVKYELDKESGLLTVDRPQKYSNVP